MGQTVASDLDFTLGARISGLPPAIAPGQPLVYGQVGQGVIESATITIPIDRIGQFWNQEVERPGVTLSNTVRCWFAPTVAEDENEIDMGQGMIVQGNPGPTEGVITFSLYSPTEAAGEFKIKFEVL